MKGKKKKKKFEQNIGLHEVFLESVPSTLIITCIAVKAGLVSGKGRFQKYLLRKLVDFSINGWVGCRKTIKPKEAVFFVH